MPRALDLFFDQLSVSGLTTVYGNPGTFEQGFLDGLQDWPQIRYVLCLHEAVAVGAAIGHARVTKKAALVQLHCSVGLGNAMAMLLEAYRSKVPMVVYVGENTQAAELKDGFLAFDTVNMASSVCKAAVRVTDHTQLAEKLREVINYANSAPRGPCLISVPMDVMEECCELPPRTHPAVSTAHTPKVHNAKEAAELLFSAKRPLILAGDLVAWDRAREKVIQIAERIGAPVYGIGWTMCNVAFDHPLFQEVLSHANGTRNAEILRHFDVVLSVGTPFGWEVFPADTSYLSADAVLIHVDSDAAELGKNQYAKLTIQCDALTACNAISQQLDTLATPAASAAAAVRANEWRHAKTSRVESAVKRWNSLIGEYANLPYAMLSALASVLPKDALIVEEAMTAHPELRTTFPLSDPERFLPTLSRPLGAGLPAAVGAAIAMPGTRVVCVSSDGAAMYVPQAIWTAAHLQLDIAFVIINNHSYRVLKMNLDSYRDRVDRQSDAYPHMDICSPAIDFVALAAGLGIPAIHVKSPAEVGSAEEFVNQRVGPRLIDLQVAGAIKW